MEQEKKLIWKKGNKKITRVKLPNTRPNGWEWDKPIERKTKKIIIQSSIPCPPNIEELNWKKN